MDIASELVHLPGAALLVTVHDELLLEVRQADAGRVGALVRRHMQAAARGRLGEVALEVDVKAGHNWYDMAHMEL